jgi:hypothetical protein
LTVLAIRGSPDCHAADVKIAGMTASITAKTVITA